MKKGLVLEGGAMRGMFTCGVADVMMEKGIAFDGAVGVSAGAVFGCNYKSGQAGRAIRYNMRFSRDKRYCSMRSLIKTGDLYGADFCYRELPQKLDIFDYDAYNSSKMEFYAVCTDVETGKPVYHRCDTCDEYEIEWLRASASMPLVSRVVEIEGRGYLDGGISDSIPLSFFESIGYGKNIVVLTQPRGYVKEKNRALPLMKLMLKKYPRLIDAMERRHEMYNRQCEYVFSRERQGDVLVICPDSALPIGRIEKDPEKLRAVYDIGRENCQRRISEICEFLK
ncbi:MAG: patatin family protein [Clostridia bacterium]|nr:patatin family protein [Clostridia bacterium]